MSVPVHLVFSLYRWETAERAAETEQIILLLFDLTMTEVWMVLVVTTQHNFSEGFSRHTQASLSRDQARFESPLAVPYGNV